MDGGDGVQGGDHQHGHVHGDEHRHGGGQEDGHPVDRLIEWTGERCVPWTGDLQVVYEHYHRYHLAAGVVAGKRVLDLASGEGYGAALMARDAEQVVGLEIDPAAVAHSRETYPLEGLEFVEGTMLDLSRFPEGSFDVVTCFEALEHVVEHDELIAQVRRVLAPGGLFFTSTPDRLVYTGHLHQHNPFHVRELSLAEFQELLGGAFTNATIWGQAVSVGSLITPVEERGAAAEVVALEHEGEEWVRKPAYAPTYYLAVASDGPLPQLPGQSVLVDVNIELVRGAQGAAQARTAEAQALAAEAESLRHDLAVAAAEATRAGAAERSLNVTAETLRAELAAQRAQLDAAIATADARRAERDHASWLLDQARAELAAITSSRIHRLALRYYRTVETAAPAGTRRRRAYSATGQAAVRGLRAAQRLTTRVPGVPGAPVRQGPALALPPTVVPGGDERTPVVSVVIPVHGKWDVTERCLRSFVDHPPTMTFELVVVDDASPDDTRERLAEVPEVVAVHLDQNQGFIGAVNAGVAAARGEYVALLNNDTEIRPGWLESLVRTASAPEVGLVGSKLVYPDGRLQEAGGIVFDDAHAWNFGRGDDPSRPMYDVRRAVDYCSGAAILLRRDLLEELGGLDTRYAPAYYEDVDLAFAVRERGLSVVYDPAAVVVHHEGVSHGTDETSGVKAYQEINREKLREKWATRLADHLPYDPANVARAARRPAGSRIVVVVDHHVPEPDNDAGSVRMYQLLLSLRDLGYGVLFVPDNRSPGEPWGAALRAAGIEVLSGWEPLEQLLTELRGSIAAVIGARVGVAWPYLLMARRILPGVPFIFDTVDLHHLREERQAELTGDDADVARARTTLELEVAFVRGADATFVVSPVEKAHLADEAPEATVCVVPTVHARAAEPAPLDGRSGLLFVGSFAHPPNADGVEWFLTEVLPIIRRSQPELDVTVVGRDAPERLRALADEHVSFTGWVPDLDPVYAGARVVVAPLRYGAGLKGKVGEAMSHGVPVVGTSVAAEGLAIEHGLTGWVADAPEDFAEGVVRLLTDDEAWAAVSTAGREHIDALLGVGAFESRLVEALATVGLSGPNQAVDAAGGDGTNP